MATGAGHTVIIDADNVVGATAATGARWWRDRSAARQRLFEQLRDHAATSGANVILVLDAPDEAVPAGPHEGVEVIVATRRGRDAADDRIRELLAEPTRSTDVEVVTSDRSLAEDARRAGVTVTGAGTFLARLRSASPR